MGEPLDAGDRAGGRTHTNHNHTSFACGHHRRGLTGGARRHGADFVSWRGWGRARGPHHDAAVPPQASGVGNSLYNNLVREVARADRPNVAVHAVHGGARRFRIDGFTSGGGTKKLHAHALTRAYTRVRLMEGRGAVGSMFLR